MDTDQRKPAGAIAAHLSLSLMRRILQEPLLHFLLLGALLFLVFHFTGNRPADSKTEVVVTPGQVAALSAGFTRTWQRPPSAGELEGLIEDQVRAEIYSREALALGLDRDDLIIRNRLRTKLEMVTENVIGQIDPTDDQLREYLNQHSGAFHREAQCAFWQIYFSSERRGARAHADARAELVLVANHGEDLRPDELGDPTLLPSMVSLSGTSAIAAQFGGEFTNALSELPIGKWSGPVKSAFGWHLVLVRKRMPGRIPELTEVRKDVEREWRNAQRKEQTEQLYQKLRKRYQVVITRPVSAMPVMSDRKETSR